MRLKIHVIAPGLEASAIDLFRTTTVRTVQFTLGLRLRADDIDASAATNVWDAALASTWERRPVWVHGDVTGSNLLVADGALHAVIDFGGLAVGDPACDLVMEWTFFTGHI